LTTGRGLLIQIHYSYRYITYTDTFFKSKTLIPYTDGQISRLYITGHYFHNSNFALSEVFLKEDRQGKTKAKKKKGRKKKKWKKEERKIEK